MSGAFRVVQFWCTGQPKVLTDFISGDAAMGVAQSAVEGIGARLGLVQRVRIIMDIDGGEPAIVFEWTRMDGLTYPPELVERHPPPKYAYGRLYRRGP